ncbi:MAG: VTT domain-containing protein [Clostridiales bacterium]|nr:VTT domain-containing protein [Clostridiales bacterium]
MENGTETKKDYGKLIKVLQIAAGVFMLAMVVVCIVLIKKFNISLKNIDGLRDMISGSPVAVGAGIILFSVIKSFALVFPPAVIFALCGIFYGNAFTAIFVNLISTFLSLSLPYFLGRFTGKNMVATLSKKFKAVKKIDKFAGANEFAIVLCIKASGIMPSDLSSLLFGAMNISYKKYMIAANLGLLPLNIMWTCLGAYGDPSDPKSYLLLLPILVFAVGAAFVVKKIEKKNAEKDPAPKETSDETEPAEAE